MRNGFYIILCLALTLTGCASSPNYGAPVTTLAGRDVHSANNAPAMENAEAKSAPDVAARDDLHSQTTDVASDTSARFELANHTEVQRKPVDAGAAWFNAQLLEVLKTERDRIGDAGPIYISTRLIRNQSKAQSDEFDAMLLRLAELLDAAGIEDGLRYTADAVQPVQYHLKGAAYLVTTDGFDLWEMYLSLKPSDRAWTLWQADAPLRLLRSARMRGQQLFPPVGAAR